MNTFNKPKVCGCNDPNIRVQDELDELYDILTRAEKNFLPTVTTDDNGKFLRVVEGIWSASEVPCAENTKF